MESTTTERELETLASFVPVRVLRRFARDPTPLMSPEVERFKAGVLFADISGFSALAERLAQKGPAGAEELTAILIGCFERLIGVIHEHGGDVIKFAGDAVLAMWEAKDEDLATMSCRAAHCALAVRAALHDYEVGGGTRLSVHSGVGAGEVTVAIVGGQLQRWELLVSGPPLIQIGLACKQAGLGEVVVAGAAWALMRERAQGVALESGDWRLESIVPSEPLPPRESVKLAVGAEEALRACIPRAVFARTGAGQDAWLAELRNVTVLFVNLPDLTETLPLKRAQAVMTAMQSALYRFEGSVNQLGADDKGITLVAAMGLPPLAHEDDPLRGVQAAQAIQARLRELGIRSAIGITTGKIYCGALGSTRRRQYAIIGDVVNLAARLMQIAPGDILCDATTYRATEAKMRFEPLPAQSVKGKAQPVALFRPYCQAVKTPGRRSMFGREAELAVMVSALEALETGVGAVVLVEGEAGIGKSRLLAEFVTEAQARGVTVLAGAGDALECSTPYHAWRTLFSELFGLEDLTTTEERRTQVRDKLAGNAEAMVRLPLLNSVISLDLRDDEFTGGMTGQVRADNTNDLLVGLLQAACCDHPIAIVIEDAHWLDSTSWALVLRVCHDIPAALFVITSRPAGELQSVEMRSLLSFAELRRIRLEALAVANTTEILCSRLGVSGLPLQVSEFVQEKSQGNPFFAEELVLALRDTGLLVVELGECRLAPEVDLSAVSFPDSVQGVIFSRLDRLPPAQQLTLKVASVIGRVFAMHILHGIYPIEGERALLPEHLRKLDELDLTPRHLSEPDLAYVFKHVITQEVAYNLMLFAQRRDLHRAVAGWYEEWKGIDLSPFYPLLAHHWTQAENREKAVHYLEKAGAQAVRSGAYRETIKFLAQAIALKSETTVSNPSEKFRMAQWQRQLGEAYVGLGQLTEGRAHAELALKLLGTPVPTSSLGFIFSTAYQVCVQIIHRISPTTFIIRNGDDRQRCQEAACAFERLAHIAYYAQDVPSIIYAAIRCLNLGENGGPSAQLARSYVLGLAASMLPVHWIARLYAKLADAAAVDLKDIHARAWVLELSGLYAFGLGEWDDGKGRLVEAVRITAEIGDWRRWEESFAQLSILHYYLGNFHESAQYFNELVTVSKKRSHEQSQAWALCGRCVNALRLGFIDEAFRFAEASDALPLDDLGFPERIWCKGLLAVTRWRCGDRNGALEAARATANLTRRTRPTATYALEGYAAVAEVNLANWETEDAASQETSNKKLARDACQQLRQYARVIPIAQPRARLWQGLFYWLGGDETKAMKEWLASLAAAKRYSMPFDEGLAHFEIGRHLGKSDPQRAEHLRAATAIFERLEARYDLERARALLS